MSYTSKDYKKGKMELSQENKKEENALRVAYRFLVRITDSNDISSVPFMATISDAFYSKDKQKMVGFLKETRKFLDQLINDLEQ